MKQDKEARITPACAGNRQDDCILYRILEDHPRVCGEQFVSVASSSQVIGSPPRVRGTERLQSMLSTETRITPACAGNRCLPGQGWQDCRDHPRVCGEQSFSVLASPVNKGSPPRVRGTEKFWAHMPRWMRITPACAGNSLCGAGR